MNRRYAAVVVAKGTTTPFRIDAYAVDRDAAEQEISDHADGKFGEGSWEWDIKVLLLE